MKFEISPLSLCEPADIDALPDRHPHLPERHLVRYRRDQQLAVVLKADEAAIEQVIDGGGEQQAVLAVSRSLLSQSRHGLQ